MNALSYILPLFVIAILIVSLVKKVEVYKVFSLGVTSALKLIFTIFPAILSVLLMSELFEKSGLYDLFLKVFSPILKGLGIPSEVYKLLLLKPFSGSGSLALLDEVYSKVGAGGYAGLCASCIFGASETVFYVTAVYYSKCKNKKATKAVVISLIATFLSAVFACFICRFFT